jgi:hypothetical protein
MVVALITGKARLVTTIASEDQPSGRRLPLSCRRRQNHGMCFSSIVEQDRARLERDFKARPGLAAFTEEPAPKLSDAGHDRCIVSITNLDPWPWPAGTPSEDLHATLEQLERPYGEH